MEEFYKRTYLSGFRSLQASRLVEYRLLWSLIIFLLYGTVAYITYTTVQAYNRSDTVVKIEEIRETTQHSFRLQFPPMSVCHTGNFNKTYIRQNIQISREISEKARALGLSEKKLLDEFIRYMNLYNIFAYVGEFDPDIWDLLNEIYEANFRSIDFSDFVSDSAHRGGEVFSNCHYRGKRVKCTQGTFTMDLTACYYFFINGKYSGEYSNEVGMKNAFTFDMRLNMSHVVDDWDDEQTYRIDELGVRFLLRLYPSPLDSPANFPANTHGIIRVKYMRVALTTRCHREEMEDEYDPALCLRDDVINPWSRTLCNCTPIINDVQTRNNEVCTPKMMRECVQRKVMASREEDEVNDFWTTATTRCRPSCNENRFLSTYSFYAIEAPDDDRIVRNRFTIFYDSTDHLLMIESSKNDRIMGVYLGGVWIVYTGMSAVAVVHACVLILVGLTKKTSYFLNLCWRRVKSVRKVRIPRRSVSEVQIRWKNRIHVPQPTETAC